ncbi:hypothetical protein VTP01DRAFT_89 [Rhizomucor pusillus]|uniref:uncharacterized protein n=1 Tax=Rhizomucor pusillus TaxID=4840 RepID=UPI0037447D79
MFPADKSQGTWKLFDADTKKDIAVDLKYEDYQHIANEAASQKEEQLTDILFNFRLEHRNDPMLAMFARCLYNSVLSDYSILQKRVTRISILQPGQSSRGRFTDNSLMHAVKEIFPGREGYSITGSETSLSACSIMHLTAQAKNGELAATAGILVKGYNCTTSAWTFVMMASTVYADIGKHLQPEKNIGKAADRLRSKAMEKKIVPQANEDVLTSNNSRN